MPNEIDDFFENATDEQKGLLFKLAETAEKEKKLADKIDGVFASAEVGFYAPGKGCGLIPCEEDDAKIISAKDRQELKIVQAQMAEYMKQAVGLNMGHLGIIKKTYKNYVGEEIPAD